MHYLDLAAAETARFDADMVALDVIECWSEPRATSAIADIRGFIGMVLDQGHAYESGGAVYFDVEPLRAVRPDQPPDRATRCWRWRAERGGNLDDPNKRDPLDFVLWQPSADDEPAWESLWGPGRPGWHIECSALALRELDTTIDLHGGGADLIFPHHECEAAQSEAATGQPFVRHWMHQAMVRMDGEKMSKSLGNLVFVSDLLKTYDPRAIRLGHASSTTTATRGSGTTTLMPAAADRLDRWLAGRRLGLGRRAERAASGAGRARRRPRHAGRGRRPSTRCGRARRGRCGRLLGIDLTGRVLTAGWASSSCELRWADSARLATARRRRRRAPSSTREWGPAMARDAGQLYTVARAVLKPLFSSCGGSSVEGLERIPATGGAIIAPNHLSVLDSLRPAAPPCRAGSPSSARPSTWTAGRRSTSSRRWA